MIRSGGWGCGDRYSAHIRTIALTDLILVAN